MGAGRNLIVFNALLLLISVVSSLSTSELKQYKQPDDVLDGFYDRLENTDENLCTRECDGKPKICYYELTVELYTSMGSACENCPSNFTACANPQCVTADGSQRGILTYNRRLPGPSIQVCEGDMVVVDVHNNLLAAGTSIHWHGIRQLGTPFSDGVPKITQCPIPARNDYRYYFNTTQAGTYFYHSHSGLQKVNGLFGSLIVRDQKKHEAFGYLYDYDLPSHVILVNDWIHKDAKQHLPGLNDTELSPNSYLINGRGIFVPPDVKQSRYVKTPVSEFRVSKGKRYRFRLIGSTCLSCTVQVKFFGHRLTTIYADGGGPVIPTTVDTVELNSGDRFDVILNADQEVDSYWILARGYGACENAQQFAILRYNGHRGKPSARFPGFSSVPKGIVLNPSNSFCNTSKEVCLHHLQSPNPVSYQSPKLKERVFIRFGFYFYELDDLFQKNKYQHYFVPSPTIHVKALMNNVSNVLPPSPLLYQYNDVPEDAFCKPECFEPSIQKSCTCSLVIKIKLHSEVTMIILDTGPYSETGLQHPFHLHGYNFYILDEGILNGTTEEKMRVLNHRLDHDEIKNDYAIQKDTVGIPSSGYAIVRFFADNPGFWFMHCHYLFHLDMGMSATLQVGELEDIPSVPSNIPKCSNFKPHI
ncbi:laccase-4-like [Cimex lectularius]|uniref:Multicopper oxidase n=1 Tax=Cimex lectularius TaxID=79782 RepID=A0A8I6TBF1_CIMLE|nr:laccase-4-like [Cimex lectularius]